MSQAEEFAKLMDHINTDPGEHYDLNGPVGRAHDCNIMFTLLFPRQVETRELIHPEAVEGVAQPVSAWIHTFPDKSRAEFCAKGKTVTPL